MTGLNYKQGGKNHWRRTVWNELVRRYRGHKRDAVVLYLAGELDLDRAEAVRRGLLPHNLIAVESDKEVAVSLRDRGVTVFNGDLHSAIAGWPQDRRVDIVIADFCSCLSDGVAATLGLWMYRKPFFRSHILVNVQRGRETGSAWDFIKTPKMRNGYVAPKHRGWHVARLLLEQDMATHWGGNRVPRFQDLALWMYPNWTERDVKDWYASVIESRLSPFMVPTYTTTGRVYMDSVVMSNPHRDWADGMPDTSVEHRQIKIRSRRRLAATLAVQTMRVNGQLP